MADLSFINSRVADVMPNRKKVSKGPKGALASSSNNITAIMQPYLFPYIGYINLVAAADHFVFLDDVNYRKRSWINRNTILLNGKPKMFSAPLVDASQNRLIKDIRLCNKQLFERKFFEVLRHAYSKAPFFSEGMDYVGSVFADPTDSISELAASSIVNFFGFMGIKKDFMCSSISFSETKSFFRDDRLIRITQLLGSRYYVNSLAGQHLYSQPEFFHKGVKLEFVEPTIAVYPQQNCEGFVPNLSIIDLVMNLGIDDLEDYINEYSLI